LVTLNKKKGGLEEKQSPEVCGGSLREAAAGTLRHGCRGAALTRGCVTFSKGYGHKAPACARDRIYRLSLTGCRRGCCSASSPLRPRSPPSPAAKVQGLYGAGWAGRCLMGNGCLGFLQAGGGIILWGEVSCTGERSSVLKGGDARLAPARR